MTRVVWVLLAGCASMFGLDSPELASDAASDGSQLGPDASSPDAPGMTCPGATDCERYVFVASATYAANLGGPAGADALCQMHADQMGSLVKGRSFRAWLGTTLTPAAVRHVHGSKQYRLVDGTVVASSWPDLTDGVLDAAISVTERGTSYTANVWTATTVSGANISPNCDDWQTTGGTGGSYGIADRSDAAWTAASGAIGCATAHAVYCMER